MPGTIVDSSLEPISANTVSANMSGADLFKGLEVRIHSREYHLLPILACVIALAVIAVLVIFLINRWRARVLEDADY